MQVTLVLLISPSLYAQAVEELMKKVKAKLELVNDYRAEGLLKTDIPFVRIPETRVTVFYKKPDKFKIKKEEGIAIVPKGGMNINLNSLFGGKQYAIIPGGTVTIHGKPLTIVKLLPLREESDVVLSTLYIDEKQALVSKASTTTKNNGTYEMELTYGKFAQWGLPDKMLFSFNTKEYKLPKGVTLEYETGEKPKDLSKSKEQKGTLEITYLNYAINKGVVDDVFTGSK
jgi:hypothetical protein